LSLSSPPFRVFVMPTPRPSLSVPCPLAIFVSAFLSPFPV
jgi:hypothetical protein